MCRILFVRRGQEQVLYVDGEFYMINFLLWVQSTIAMLTPVQKPTQLINPAGGAASSASVELAYSEMSDEQLRKLEKENPEKFMQLFKAEFGYVPKIDK